MVAPPLWQSLPFGAIVALCDLVACRLTDTFDPAELDRPRRPDIAATAASAAHTWTERALGDFSRGRYGWVLANIRSIRPIPFRGAQQLFDVPDDLFLASDAPISGHSSGIA